VTTLLLAALLAAAAWAPDAAALFVPGAGDGPTECWIGLRVDGVKPLAATGRRRVRVVQEACAGACDFSVNVCLNNAGCESAVLRDVHILGRLALDRPRAVFPVRVCGKPGTVTLELGGRRRAVRRKLVLIAGDGRRRGGRRDVDVVTLVCRPPPPDDDCVRCGDGRVDEGEECDDDNDEDGDGCDRNCTVSACGNGVRAGDERCDDGNTRDGDGCDSNCTPTACGNGVVTAGEECDPPGATLGPMLVCDASCREQPVGPCTCPSPDAARLVVQTTALAASCGIADLSTGPTFRQLDCGGLYLGGGDATVEQPIPVPAGIAAAFAVTCSATRLTLGQTTPETAGAPGRCTAAGCRFGPPLAAPNTLSASLSACVVSTVSRAASGEAACDTGRAAVTVPLTAEVFLTGGDQAPAEPGLQACPVCVANRCRGGANHGGACTPYADAVATSHDCPPLGPPLDELSFELAFSTEPLDWTAAPSGTQARVFCGYCRDADETLAFAEPAVACLEGGRLRALCGAPFESCEQRHQGAFGPNGGGVGRILLAGTSAGPLEVGIVRQATLASVFCVPPVAGDVVNANVSLPGPAALTLPVEISLETP
jgi:cysteine-rich repeat protein